MKKVIFIIECEPDYASRYKYYLDSEQFSLIMVPDAQIGLNLLHLMDVRPDLILCDFNLPVMNGSDFLIELTKNPKYNTIPFFYLMNKKTNRDNFFNFMDDFVEKIPKNVEKFEFISFLYDKLNIDDFKKPVLYSRLIPLSP